MSELSNDTKKHTTKSRKAFIPFFPHKTDTIESLYKLQCNMTAVGSV
jgi:hypothetical protein